MKHVTTFARIAIGLSLFGLVVTSTGCQTWDVRGPGFGQDAAWGAPFREGGPGGRVSGIDTRARQIEQSLGVR